MTVLKRIELCGILPVVVLDRVEDAVPTANALHAGGVDVMEITLRTPAGLEAIRTVRQHCPDVCVGAGTVRTLEQCKQAADAGAMFIVSPGFDREVVQWCVDHDVAVVPGCVTPSEITDAMALGLAVVKFFPANVYGGLDALKSLAGPFPDVAFIPTGGVNEGNLGAFLASPFIHAVGGTWFCTQADIRAGNFEKITVLSARALDIAHGFALAHVGINCPDEPGALDLAMLFDRALHTGVENKADSVFASAGVEIMKAPGHGTHGHLAFRCNHMERGIFALEKRGFSFDPAAAKYDDRGMVVAYLTQDFGGFAVHLLRG